MGGEAEVMLTITGKTAVLNPEKRHGEQKEDEEKRKKCWKWEM